MLAYSATRREICGELIAPGEEILSLQGRLEFLYECDDEDQLQHNLDELYWFIEPARQYLEKLRTVEVEAEERSRELLSEIEDGEKYIADAEWILANQEEALSNWREGRE